MRTIVGQPGEDSELISQTEQWDSDALLQTANPFSRNAAQCRANLHETIPFNNARYKQPPPSPVAHCYRRGKTHPMPNPHLAASSIKGCARKSGGARQW